MANNELKLLITLSDDQLKQGMADAAATVKKTTAGMSDEFGSMSSKIKGHVAGIGTAIASAFSLAAIGFMTKQVIEASLSMERITFTMKAAAGSSEAAAKELQFIREECQRLGLDLADITHAYAKFSASTRNTAVEGEQTRRIFSGVAEAATALRLTTDETNGIFLALYQMMSKGRISAEELSGQLGERLPGAVRLTAEAMGLTTSELLKQMQEGKLMSADVLPKLAEQLHKTYGQTASESAQGGQAVINRFNNEILESKAAIGDNLMPVMIDLLSAFKDIPKYINTFIGTYKFMIVDVLAGIDKLKIYINDLKVIAAAAVVGGPLAGFVTGIAKSISGLSSQAKKELEDIDARAALAKADIVASMNKGTYPSGKPEGKPTGKPDGKGSDTSDSKTASRVPDWKNELEQMKVAEEAFFNFSLSREQAFWENKLKLAKANSAESSAVQHELYEIRKKQAQTATEEEITNLKLIQSADKTGPSERIALQEEIIAATESLYGQDSSNYRNAVREKRKIEEDASRESMNIRLSELKSLQASEKADWAQKLALEDQKLAIIKDHYGLDSREYKNALLEKQRLEEDAALASIAIQQRILENQTSSRESAIRIKEIETHTLSELGRISAKEEIELNRQRLDEIFNLKLAALNREAELLKQYPERYREALDRIKNLENQHNIDIAKSQQTLALEQKSRWDAILSPIRSALDSSVQGIIQGTTTLKQAMSNLCSSILTSYANMLMQIALKWAQQQAMELVGIEATQAAHTTAAATTAATTAAEAAIVIPAKAAEAGAGAAASQAFIPFIGPALALAAMATIFGAVMALKSAAGGYDVPSGTNPLTQLHAEEMVLPANLANNIRTMTNRNSALPKTDASITILAEILSTLGSIQLLVAEIRDITKSERKLSIVGEIQSGNSIGLAASKYLNLPIAAGGFDVPSGLNPVTQLHAEEMVLPANVANKVRNMSDQPVAAAGGGNVTFNVNAFDSRDVASFFKKHGSSIANALKGPQRSFQLSSIMKGR